MKLYMNTASPYARLVNIVVQHLGLTAVVDYHNVDPWQQHEQFLAISPTGKIPVLVNDDGIVLTESSCICDYLIDYAASDSLSDRLSDQRLALLGLGRAAMDCAFGIAVQARFGQTEGELSKRWAVSIKAIAAEVDKLVSKQNNYHHVLDLATIVLVVAFDYTDFRLADIHWRSVAPTLDKYISQQGSLDVFIHSRPK